MTLRTRNRMISAVCAAMLVLTLPMLGLADDSQTTALVKFKEGVLQWDGASMDGMFFSFGEQFLPVAQVTYDSENPPHEIVVNDPRNVPNLNGWNVKVSMSQFVAETTPHAFNGTITLATGTATGTNGADATNVVVVPTVSIVGSVAPVSTSVATATNTPMGQFNIEWATAPQAKLTISTPDVAGIVLGEQYTATLTWVLSAGTL